MPNRDGPARSGPARWMRLAAAVVGLAVVGLAARELAGRQWERVARYRTPFAFELEPGAATDPLAGRVILVVIEGLRADATVSLPALRALAERGAAHTVRASTPSLAYPAWTELLTGAPPDISGVTLDRGPVAIDSLFRQEALAGRVTAVAGGTGWRELFGDWVTEGSYRDDASDEATGDEALRLLEEVDPALLVVHLGATDRAAHRGGVDRAYLDAAREADAVVARLVEATADRAALIVTGGHGHLAEGGHGGLEPEVLRSPLVVAGAGIRAMPSREMAQSDVAPTIAALLGLPRPTHALGRPLIMIEGGASARSEIGQAHREVSIRFATRAAEAIGRGATGLATLDQARRDEERSGMLIRAPLGMVSLLVAAWLLVLLSRGRDPAAVTAGAVTILVTAGLLFFARGGSFSLSRVPGADVEGFLLARMAEAVLAGLAGGVVCGMLARRRELRDVAGDGLATALWSMALPALVAATYFVRFGWASPGRIPDTEAVLAHGSAVAWGFGLGLTAGAVALAAVAAATLRGRGASVD